MAKNIVFVLHGVGQYTNGWMNLESCAVPALKAASANYPFFEGKSLDSFIEFVPILYDDVFERIMKHWAKLGDGLRGALPVMPGFADKVVTQLEAADDNKWWLNTGADTVLYYGFRLFQQRVVLRVLSQMCRKIADTIASSNEVPDYHVLAHSLGTAVAHDALHHLGTEAWLDNLKSAPLNDADGVDARGERDLFLEKLAKTQRASGHVNPFSPDVFSFESITMLSNVSGVIHSAANPYHSIVRPGSASDHGAFTRNYLNVNHKFDPISIIGDFKIPKGWQLQGGYDITVEHLDGQLSGIHEAAHYVSHPDVHLRLLQLYVDSYVATDADVAQVAAYKRKFSVDTTASERVIEELRKVAKGEKGPLGPVIGQLTELLG